MQHNNHNGLVWLEFELFQSFPQVTHAVLTRHGGESEAPYDTLNIANDVGDCEETVAQNLERIKKQFQFKQLTWAKQVHGFDVVQVTKENQDEIPQCDAFITNEPDIALMIKHADCQVAIMYDPINHAVGNVHSGWRGSVQNIYSVTIKAMQKAFGTDPTKLLVAIGPSLGPEAAEFKHYEKELPKSFWDFRIDDRHFDFWAISERQLTQCGVQPENIEIARICTHSNPSDFFSYRRDKVTGRHGTIVMLSSRSSTAPF